jgi:hypothetical protein
MPKKGYKQSLEHITNNSAAQKNTWNRTEVRTNTS